VGLIKGGGGNVGAGKNLGGSEGMGAGFFLGGGGQFGEYLKKIYWQAALCVLRYRIVKTYASLNCLSLYHSYGN